jgi:uncharacterized protein involved in exopolysaccharide biosynthesis
MFPSLMPGNVLSLMLRTARRDARLLLAVIIPLPVLVAAASLLSDRQYSVSAAFIPQEPPSAAQGLSALTSQLGLSGGRVNIGPQFYADLLTSSPFLREVSRTRYDVPGFRGSLVEYFEMEGDSLRALLDTQKQLTAVLDVVSNRNTGVVKIRVRTKNPALSLSVVQRFLALTNDFNLNRRQTSGRNERRFLEHRVQVSRASLNEAERALLGFDQQNRVASTPQIQWERQRLEREVNLRSATLITIAQQLEMARTDEIRDTPVIVVVERPEDSLEPVARGTVTKTLLAAIVAGCLTLLLIWVRSRSGASTEILKDNPDLRRA